VAGFKSEWWPESNRNGGRLQIGIPGRIASEFAPGSLDELARITGKAKSNLSRTLRTMEGYGLVSLERGERGRITPKVMHDRVELDLPLTLLRKAS
jgi:predicted transcriptional regulator